MKFLNAPSRAVLGSLVSCVVVAALVGVSAGCRSSRPLDMGTYDATIPMATPAEEDLLLGTPLPSRGNFDPQSDVSYGEFSQHVSQRIQRSADEHTGTEVGKIYFATNSNAILPSQRPKLELVGNWMLQNPTRSILIAGHCDERGTFEYNRALGERRAIAVRNYLIGLGISGDRLHTFSYGEEKPAVLGTGEAVWAQNRRAEIGVINE